MKGTGMKTLTLAISTIGLWAAAAVPTYAQAPLSNAYGGPGQVVTDVALPTVGATQGNSTTANVPPTTANVPAPTGGSAEVSPPLGGQVKNQTEASSAARGVKNVTAATAPSGDRAIRTASGSLPFTGFDVLLMLAAGGVLLAAGIAMRRLAR